MTKAPVKRQPTPHPKPATEPIIESWRPAGGEVLDAFSTTQKLSSKLGIAHVPTWRLTSFLPAVKILVGEIVDGTIEWEMRALEDGGESMTDVFVRVRSEVVAEIVREKIQGCLIEGRMVRVGFA